MAFSIWVSPKPSFLQNPNPLFPQISRQTRHSQSSRTQAIQCGLRELRERIDSIKSTQKITEAMKLVAAARVRRAQDAVINGRPFSETLVEVLYDINEQLQGEDIDIPLTNVRAVKRVAIVVISSDRGLCGGFNNALTKKAQTRIGELKKLGLEVVLISVGKKGNSYFMRRPEIKVDRLMEGGTFPTAKEAQVIADDVFSLFVSEEVDKVELVYTKFVSLVKSEPVIQTLLPLSPRGEVVDVNGNCVDAIGDEMFRLTSKEGKLALERGSVKKKERKEMSPLMEFEQDPVQILDAMMPLYLNSQILRALQESAASELAARMNAMSNATDNADELKKTLSRSYNRARQAKITGELLEIVAGAEALRESDKRFSRDPLFTFDCRRKMPRIRCYLGAKCVEWLLLITTCGSNCCTTVPSKRKVSAFSFKSQTFLGTKSNIHENPSIWRSTEGRSVCLFHVTFHCPLVPLAAWVLHKIYLRWNSFNHLQISLWNLEKVVVLGGTSQSEKGRQPPMGDRYLSRQGSGVWRSFRYGDFEEEDVWDVIRDRKNSNTMPVRSKESSVSVPRRLPTASRMIPRASSHNYGSGSSYSSSNNTHEAKIVQQSAPVHIPSWSKANGQKSNKGSHNSSWHNERDDSDDDDIDEDGDHDDEDEEEEEDDYNTKEPPHEFLARRLARSQISSFSVFEGAGRTLKGRDLSKVRNAVLTKTGFLESL